MLEGLFIVKKIVAAVCMPLPLFFIMSCLALLMYWRKQLVLAKSLSILSGLFLYLISIQITGDTLANSLEAQYPRYQADQVVPYVLVLGSAHYSDPEQPISSLLSSAGLKRLVEGVHIYRQNPGAKLLVSGYRFDDDISQALALKKVALHFGVPTHDIILAEQVKDTQEEAAYWIEFVKNESLVLVTTAIHMPRSLFLFKKEQEKQHFLGPIYPAPADHISHNDNRLTWQSWFPSARNMHRVERVWHEYLGLLWAKLIA